MRPSSSLGISLFLPLSITVAVGSEPLPRAARAVYRSLLSEPFYITVPPIEAGGDEFPMNLMNRGRIGAVLSNPVAGSDGLWISDLAKDTLFHHSRLLHYPDAKG